MGLPVALLLATLSTSSPVAQADARAAREDEMRPYSERVSGVEFRMLPIPSGTFLMGSPPTEAGRGAGEGPRHEVRVGAFWMGAHEVTWDEYHPFMLRLDLEERARGHTEGDEPAPQDALADAVSRPTPPYVAMDFGMGVEGRPAVCMTQFAAKQYTKWLSRKTGRFYRLPTEAEWEYACRAGTSTAYSFGDDPARLPEHAWYLDNADGAYHEVGLKKPNPWGLHDMHGNVAEWVLDRYDEEVYAGRGPGVAVDPVAWPTELFPRVVRGGSWDDEAAHLRSAARRGSRKGWKRHDPQIPKSIWYHTDASFVGFRVVRPLVEPGEDERARFWEADLESIRRVEERQRRGGR